MSLINWLLLFEVLASIGIILWIFKRMHKHAKHSPAEIALKKHLQDLELYKKNKDQNKLDMDNK